MPQLSSPIQFSAPRSNFTTPRILAQPNPRPSATQSPSCQVARPSLRTGAGPSPLRTTVRTPIDLTKLPVIPEQDLRNLTPQEQLERKQRAQELRKQQKALYNLPGDASARGPTMSQVGAMGRLPPGYPVVPPVTCSVNEMVTSGSNSGPFEGMFPTKDPASGPVSQMRSPNLPSPHVQVQQSPRAAQAVTSASITSTSVPSFARKTICFRCRVEGWDDTCDGADICKNCELTGKACYRVRCPKDCTRSKCWRIHTSDNYPDIRDCDPHRKYAKSDQHLHPSPVEQERAKAKTAQEKQQDLRKEAMTRAQQIQQQAPNMIEPNNPFGGAYNHSAPQNGYGSPVQHMMQPGNNAHAPGGSHGNQPSPQYAARNSSQSMSQVYDTQSDSTVPQQSFDNVPMQQLPQMDLIDPGLMEPTPESQVMFGNFFTDNSLGQMMALTNSGNNLDYVQQHQGMQNEPFSASAGSSQGTRPSTQSSLLNESSDRTHTAATSQEVPQDPEHADPNEFVLLEIDEDLGLFDFEAHAAWMGPYR